MFIPHVLSFVFAFISSPPANDHAIPRPTTASTQRRSTILTTYRINCLNTDWNPMSQLGTVHSYLRAVTFHVHARSVASYSVAHAALVPLTHIQFAPGTFSDVNIFTGFASVLISGSAANMYCVCQNNTRPLQRMASMMMSIFCIDFRVWIRWDQS